MWGDGVVLADGWFPCRSPDFNPAMIRRVLVFATLSALASYASRPKVLVVAKTGNRISPFNLGQSPDRIRFRS